MHGKDIADRDGSAVSRIVCNSYNDNYGEGSINLVRHLAKKHLFPNKERCTRYFGFRGLYATTRYMYMSLDHNSIDEAVVAVDSGYDGSSQDHYYHSAGLTEIASQLFCRERIPPLSQN